MSDVRNRPRPAFGGKLLLAVALAAAAMLGFTTSTQAQSSPSPYWQARAALLDPASFDYYTGPSWSFTVPPGATWYALNVWQVTIDGALMFQRPLDARDPLILPAGTTVRALAGNDSFAYVSKPEKVTGDVRYAAPESLYWQRLERLDRLPQRTLAASLPSGTGRGALAVKEFPADVDAAMLTHVSTHDTAWTIFGLAGGKSGASNLDNETSDDHPIRYAAPTVAPFRRSTFPNIMVRAASPDGFLTQPGMAGVGVIRYAPLPSDW